MTVPAGYVPASQASPPGNWHRERDQLIRAAHVVLDNCGVQVSAARVNRLVQTFQNRVARNGFAFFDFLANSVQLDADTRRCALADPDVRREIAYADPTGETAATHVDRERGWR